MTLVNGHIVYDSGKFIKGDNSNNFVSPKQNKNII